MTNAVANFMIACCCGGIVALPVLAALVIVDEVRRWRREI